ncbi:hypothetical protein D3C76_1245740 [compost metagenome]
MSGASLPAIMAFSFCRKSVPGMCTGSMVMFGFFCSKALMADSTAFFSSGLPQNVNFSVTFSSLFAPALSPPFWPAFVCELPPPVPQAVTNKAMIMRKINVIFHFPVLFVMEYSPRFSK